MAHPDVLSCNTCGLRQLVEPLAPGRTAECARCGSFLAAAVAFLASIAIPLVKLSVLLYLVLSTKLGFGHRLRDRTRIFRFVDVVGPWAMLDVFLLAVLVALVKLGTIATILPGPGLVSSISPGWCRWPRPSSPAT